MLVTDFIELELKQRQCDDIVKKTWHILSDIKTKYNINYNDRTLDMREQELEKIRRSIMMEISRSKRS